MKTSYQLNEFTARNIPQNAMELVNVTNSRFRVAMEMEFAAMPLGEAQKSLQSTKHASSICRTAALHLPPITREYYWHYF
jgi:hypothetical protein